MRAAALLPVAALALLTTACGGSGGAKASAAELPAFDNRGGATVSCLQHQTREPDAAYAPSTAVNSVALLDVLAYYTANGNRPYCDGKPPTATDRTWLRLYVSSGADASHIQRQG